MGWDYVGIGAVAAYMTFLTGHVISNALYAYASTETLESISEFKKRHRVLELLGHFVALDLVDYKLEQIEKLESQNSR